MSGAGAALEFETLKFRRAPVVRTISALIGVALPLLGAAFMVAATSDKSSQIGLKAAAMMTGTGWPGYLAMVGMLLSVGGLMGVGFVVCWCFGREFTDKTQACLFALPVSRQRLAHAKFVVILWWSLLLCLISLAVALVAGIIIGLGTPAPNDLLVAGKAFIAGILAALLALPLALVASIARGYLPGVGALILLVVITQVVTAFGSGAWFPYAAPSLWMGMGGTAAAEAVNPVQLFLCIPVSALGITLTGMWWKTMQINTG